MMMMQPGPKVVQVDLEFADTVRDEVRKLGLKKGEMIYEKSLGIHLMYIGNGDFVVKGLI